MEHSQAIVSVHHTDKSKVARLLSMTVCGYIYRFCQFKKFVLIMHLFPTVVCHLVVVVGLMHR